MKKIISALLVFMSLSSVSLADAIYVGVLTKHYDNNEIFNNKNELLAVEVSGFYGASFINSYGYQSYFIGKEKSLMPHVSILYGMSYGYSRHCSYYFGGTRKACREKGHIPDFMPLMTVKISKKLGPFSGSIMVSDYLNLSLGLHF